MTDQLIKTAAASTGTQKQVDDTTLGKPVKFKIERIDEVMARKIDMTQSVTVINIDFLRKQKEELENEIGAKQKMLDDITEVVSAFDSQPIEKGTIDIQPEPPIVLPIETPVELPKQIDEAKPDEQPL